MCLRGFNVKGIINLEINSTTVHSSVNSNAKMALKSSYVPHIPNRAS